MTQPTYSSDAFPTMGTVPLGPDEPELFRDAMVRILRHLDDDLQGKLPRAQET